MSALRLCISHIRCGRQKFWLQALRSRQPRSQVRKDLSGPLLTSLTLFPLFSTATTSFWLLPWSCLDPILPVTSSGHPQPCPSACLVGRIPESSLPHHYPHIWLLSFLHLNPGIFLFHIVSLQWTSPKVQETDSWLSIFRCLALPWAVKVCCWNCKGSPALTVVGTCSARMKASRIQLLKWKESQSYPLSMFKFSFLKAYNIARFGQVFRRAKGISPMKGNSLQGREMPELFKAKVTIAF